MRHLKALLAGTLLASVLVVADTGKVDEELVVTLSNYWSSAGTVDWLTEEEIERASAIHPTELFGQMPGVWISRGGSGQEHLSAIRSPVLTGAGACGAFLFAVEGVPIRPGGFCNVNNLFEVPLEFAKRVMILKGPASAVAGGNALHGVMDIELPDQNSPQRLELRRDLLGHSRLMLGLGRAQSWRLDMALSHDEGWRDQSGYAEQKLNYRHFDQWGNYSATWSLALTNLNQETAGYIVGTDAYKSPRAAVENRNPEAYRDAYAGRLGLRLSRQRGRGALVWNLYLRTSDMAFLQHFLPGTPVEENDHKSLGVLAEYRRGGWSWGGQMEWADVNLNEYQQGATTGFRLNYPQGKHYDYSVSSQQLAGFVRYRGSTNQGLGLVLDLRAESMTYDYANHILSGSTDQNGNLCGANADIPCRFTRPESRDDGFANLGARFGLHGKFGNKLSWKASYGKAFRPPQMTELYRLRGGQSVADIDSESLHALEYSLSYTGYLVFWKMAAFIQKKSNSIYRDANDYYHDNGKTSHRGLEAEITFLLGDQLTLASNLTWSRHRYEFDAAGAGREEIVAGNHIDTAPEWIGGMALRWAPTDESSWNLEWQHMGEYYTDAANLHSYQGHSLWHLSFRTPLSSGWQLSTGMRNLTNERYAERADYSVFGGDRYFPGHGVNIWASLKREW